MSDLSSIIWLAAGIAAGGAAAWFFLRPRSAAMAAKTDAEFQSQLAMLSERVRAKDDEIARLKEDLKNAEGQARENRDDNVRLAETLKNLENRIASERS